MGLLDNLVSEFTHRDQHQSEQPSQQYSNEGPPPVSPPWYAEWDGRDQRWLFINQQTGERTFNYPGPGFSQQQGDYGNRQGAYNQSSYDPTGNYHQQEQEQKHGGNGWKYAAAGVGGLAGGALLMHEGEEAKEHWDEDKYRVESDVQNFPENAAGWTGEQVGRVEHFDDNVENNIDNFDNRVENKWDNAVNDVEDFPEDAARWTGEKVQDVEDIPQDMENKWDNAVGDVENFGDRMDNAYDEGRDEQRYDDDRGDDY